VQSGGPAVALQDSGLAKPYFTAPAVPAGSPSVTLTFQLVASNGFASSGVATTTVTVVGVQNPVVSAGNDQSVTSGAQVHLNGSVTDPNGTSAQPLTYLWSQTSGPTVTLDNRNSVTPTFIAPTMSSGQAAQVLGFQLTATDALGLTGTATTKVTVQPIVDTLTITNATYSTSKSRLQVTATSSTGNGVPVLTLHVSGHPDTVMTYDPNAKTYTVDVIVNPIPGSVTVTSSFGGSATSTLTRVR
jgi:hypothetical protein